MLVENRLGFAAPPGTALVKLHVAVLCGSHFQANTRSIDWRTMRKAPGWSRAKTSL